MDFDICRNHCKKGIRPHDIVAIDNEQWLLRMYAPLPFDSDEESSIGYSGNCFMLIEEPSILFPFEVNEIKSECKPFQENSIKFPNFHDLSKQMNKIRILKNPHYSCPYYAEHEMHDWEQETECEEDG